jgi:tetraacyldisaccharide 4'-kinase
MRAPDFWKSRGFAALLLAPLGMLYGLSVAYKARTTRSYRCAVPVICVGNLTAGGSGKTPVAMAIADALKARGGDIFFLTRGYGGKAEGPLQVSQRMPIAMTGDEALLLARAAPTVLSRNRAAGALFAVKQGATAIVMDDGHQNFSLAKTLSLVVVDDLGNGLQIPAGPLRESVGQGLARADAVIVMNDNKPDLRDYSGPVLQARLVADGAAFRGRRVFAFAGIGRPEKFLASLQDAGAIIAGSQFFADHHPYSGPEIAQLRSRAGDAALVTTQKDFVRLEAAERTGIEVLPIAAVFQDPQLLDRLLSRV